MSLDDLQAQLRGALDQQFAALKQQYETAIGEARQQAAAEAQRNAEGRLAQIRAEMESRLAESLANARAETERLTREAALVEQKAAEHRLRKEIDRDFQQQLEHVINSVKRSAEVERENERRRFQVELDTERERASADLAMARERAAAEVEAAREQVRAEMAAERDRMNAEAAAERERAQAEIAQMTARVQADLANERERIRAEAMAAAFEKSQTDIEAITAEADAAKAEIEAARVELETELRRVTAEYREQMQRIRGEQESERERLLADIETERQRADAIPPPQPVAPSKLPALVDAVRELDDTRTLTQALDALVTHAATVGRAALFVIDGDRLKFWKALGIADVDVRSVESSIGGRDLLARAIQAGQAMQTSSDLPAPPFARASAARAGAGVPVMIGGRAVAVLYVDHGEDDTQADVAADFALVEALARHASAVVALRTATRTLDVVRGVPLDAAAAEDESSDEQGARRFARLLVSEIKLYNEAAVRAGRQQRDLLQRLGPEIDRARRLYEERVPASLGSRHAYFHQELVQTLADGDPALLGAS